MEDHYDKMDRYLDGMMEPAERKAFEESLKEDPSLSGELKLLRELRQKIGSDQAEKDLETQLGKLGNTYFEPQYREHPGRRLFFNRRKIIWTLSAAAAVALILFVFNPFSTSLFQQFADFPEAAFTTLDNRAGDPLVLGQRFYNTGNFTQAKEQFLLYLSDESNRTDAQIQFFTGLCHLKLNEYEEAIQIFSSLAEGTSLYREEGSWWLAMTYLKQERFLDCWNQLQTIHTTSIHYEEAQDLIKKLEATR